MNEAKFSVKFVSEQSLRDKLNHNVVPVSDWDQFDGVWVLRLSKISTGAEFRLRIWIRDGIHPELEVKQTGNDQFVVISEYLRDWDILKNLRPSLRRAILNKVNSLCSE